MSDFAKKFIYFGTDKYSAEVLSKIIEAGFKPSMIVSGMDKKEGRGQVLTKTPVKIVAEENSIPLLQPEKLDEDFIEKIKSERAEYFVVVFYNKILKKEVLNIPPLGSINLHPSLLPKYRGPSPVKTQILNDEKEVGVSIMLLDEGMDSGPILSKKQVEVSMPIPDSKLMPLLVEEGAKLLIETLPKYLSGEITAKEQDESLSTVTKKINKEDGELNLSGDDYKNYLKYLAYSVSPGTYFFAERKDRKIRVKIKHAEFSDGKFRVLRVVPEGGKEMDYSDFLRG